MPRRVLSASFFVALTCALTPIASASAANQVDCAADAVKVTVAGASTLNPITASTSKCGVRSTGLPNTTEAVMLDSLIGAKTAYAITETDPDGAKPMLTTYSAAAGVEGLTVTLGTGSTVIGADAVRSFAQAKCVGGALELTGGSDAVKLNIGGQELALDTVLVPLTDTISGILNPVLSVKLNEQIKDGTSIIQRGAHIQVLSALGAAPLADVIIAESRATGAGLPCDPTVPENTDGGTGGVGGVTLGKACPTGSVFDAPRGLCLIPAVQSGGQGDVIIGRPYQGPNVDGGRVVALTVARKKYKSVCLKGAGPAYAVVGTSKRDRITGTNSRDRILGVGGNDALDGGRGNDCLDGGSGRDNLNGAIGNDRVYGTTGSDALNGGPGNDYLSGGSGNDSINAAFGSDRVFGGSGNDAINTATAGRRARVNCGTGRDKFRANPEEVRRSRGCETILTFRSKR